MANKPTDTPTGYMIAQCQLILLDENETPARRKLAEKWLSRLIDQTDCWEGGGRTKAEAAGIEVPAGAPGGAKHVYGGNPGGRRYTGQPLEDGDEAGLSSEVSSGYRSRRWSAERHGQ